MPALRSPAGPRAAPVTAGNSPAPAPPPPQPQAAASTHAGATITPIQSVSIDWRATRAGAFVRQQARFWACHTRTPAEELPATKRRPRPLMTPWMIAGGTKPADTDVSALTVQIWDSELGSNAAPYTSFHVLARNDRDTVVGRSEQGAVYLRVVRTRWLPRDTFNQLLRVLPKTQPELAARYDAKAFTAAAYERPAAAGADAYTEPVYLILEGTLTSMGCNEVRTLRCLRCAFVP